DRAHESVRDREFIIQHLRHWRQAVRRATGVGDDFVLLRIVSAIVYAYANRDVRIFGWRADQHAFGACLQMQLGLVSTREQARGFEHYIDVQFFPREVRWIAILQNPDFVAPNDDIFVIVTNHSVEFTMYRIPFEEMGERVRVGEVVHRDNTLNLRLWHGTKDIASDAPETVDSKISHRKKSKVEELNRYAEKLQRPTAKRRGRRSAVSQALATGAVALNVVYFQMKYAVAAFLAMMS